MGIRVFIVVCMRNAKSQFQPNKAFWLLKLATGTSREFESQANCLARLEVLPCSALAVVNLQLLCMLHTCASFGDLPIASRSQDPVARLFLSAHILSFLTLSHTLPLHRSHLNTGYLIAKLQANLAWNKANTWLNKFKLIVYFNFIL